MCYLCISVVSLTTNVYLCKHLINYYNCMFLFVTVIQWFHYCNRYISKISAEAWHYVIPRRHVRLHTLPTISIFFGVCRGGGHMSISLSLYTHHFKLLLFLEFLVSKFMSCSPVARLAAFSPLIVQGSHLKQTSFAITLQLINCQLYAFLQI